jgi:hypothetical protein
MLTLNTLRKVSNSSTVTTTIHATTSSSPVSVELKQAVDRLSGSPELAFDLANFKFHDLVKNLPLLLQNGIFPSKNKYYGSGETEIFIYNKKGMRTPPEHKEKLNFEGEKELGRDVYAAYYRSKEDPNRIYYLFFKLF